MFKIVSTAAVALVFCVASSAVADEELTRILDADKDGFVSATEAELMPELQEQFAKLDVNQDGKLEAAEIEAFMKKG